MEYILEKNHSAIMGLGNIYEVMLQEEIKPSSGIGRTFGSLLRRRCKIVKVLPFCASDSMGIQKFLYATYS